jgi:hypothetical protein
LEWYEAEIVDYNEIEEVYIVVFTEYGNEAECTIDQLRLPEDVRKTCLVVFVFCFVSFWSLFK